MQAVEKNYMTKTIDDILQEAKEKNRKMVQCGACKKYFYFVELTLAIDRSVQCPKCSSDRIIYD